MYTRLLAVYDEEYGLGNIITALSLEVKEVIYFYRDTIFNKYLHGLAEIFTNQSKVFTAIYVDNNEILKSFLEDDNYILDISSSKRIGLKLFEYSLNNNSMIVYYDKEENKIKDYKMHQTIKSDLYKMSIKEILLCKGAVLRTSMHTAPKLNDQDYINKFMLIMNLALKNYKRFTSFIIKLESSIKNSEQVKGITNNQYFKLLSQLSILKLENKKISIIDKRFKELFEIVGKWLEDYLYIILANSQQYDEVVMSAVIDFEERKYRYPISCEVDGIILKNNHLILLSCKSNALNKDAINEIALHNYFLGNNMSHSLLAIATDINVKSPALYLKAKELKVAILDYPKILQADKIIEQVNNILEDKYEYEEVI